MSPDYFQDSVDRLSSSALQVLSEFDRLEPNPDRFLLAKKIQQQIAVNGQIELTVFVCPSYKPSELLGPNPEEYLSVNVKDNDLFAPRVPRLRQIQDKLRQQGLNVQFNLLVGDTDPEAYVLPALKKYGEQIPIQMIRERQKEYVERFANRPALEELNATVVSVADLDISLPEKQMTFPKEWLSEEVGFLRWLFSNEGPYLGKFEFDDSELWAMAQKKFELYGEQGYVVEVLTGGIILQTERPWQLRTQMLQSTGASVAAIYPWIRSEELVK